MMYHVSQLLNLFHNLRIIVKVAPKLGRSFNNAHVSSINNLFKDRVCVVKRVYIERFNAGIYFFQRSFYGNSRAVVARIFGYVKKQNLFSHDYSIIAIVSPTLAAPPSLTKTSLTVPDTGLGILKVALSVTSSTRFSPSLTVSPTCLCQYEMLALSTPSASSGNVTFVIVSPSIL